MPKFSHQSYRLLAQSLGRAKEYIKSSDVGLTAFNITLENIIMDLLADNPLFDADRFRKAIDSAASDQE